MAFITYTAKRRLATDHVATTSYSLEFKLKRYSPEFKQKKNTKDSIDGTTETVLWNIQELWTIDAWKFLDADLPLWDEFFASVAASESFTYDASGTIAVPVNPIAVEMVGQPRISRIKNLKKFTANFKVKVL